MDENDFKEFKFRNHEIEYCIVCAISKKIAKKFRPPDISNFSNLKNSVQTSIQKFRNLEESSSMDINKYVELYNSKI